MKAPRKSRAKPKPAQTALEALEGAHDRSGPDAIRTVRKLAPEAYVKAIADLIREVD